MILSVLSSLALVSGLMVVRAKNPVHSVLFFILVFCNTSGLLILLGLDFFAMIFLVVYIGAIAVLFLFVVMMLNIQIAEIHEKVLRYLPVSGIIGLIFWWEMFFILDNDYNAAKKTARKFHSREGWRTMILSVLSSLALVSGLMVVRAKNPVHSVLFFILVFCNTSGLLILLGLDFFAMIFLVVYIGAIAVLFLFVVMMLNIQIAEIHEKVLRYLPVSGIIGLIFWWEMFFILDNDYNAAKKRHESFILGKDGVL